MNNNQFTKEGIIEDTYQHRDDVIIATVLTNTELVSRVTSHDIDKLIPHNAQVLAESLNTKNFTEWNEIHMKQQRHHSEWIHNNLKENGANLLDLLEMCIDGMVANYRRNNNNATYEEQVKFFKRKGFDEQLSIILANTFMNIRDSFSNSLEEERE